jgi:hypothetical protein
MARLLRPSATARAAEVDRQTVVDAEEARSSAIRLRIAPTRDSATFLAWAQEQVTATTTVPLSEEVRLLENRLISALRARDNSLALLIASAIVYSCPEHEIARRIKARCAQRRGATLAFPRHDAVAHMRLAWHDMEGRNLSRRAAYMLSCIDGFLTVEQLIDVSAMEPLTAYDTIDNLLRDGIIELT